MRLQQMSGLGGCGLGLLIAVSSATAQWPQWGGPSRDFRVEAEVAGGLQEAPRLLWQRTLGDGESSVLVEDERLFVMFRDAGDEVIAALATRSGATAWEYRYAQPIPESIYVEHGDGPHATPVIAGNLICGVGIAGKLHCLDKANGKLRWSHDLLAGFDGRPPDCGYGAGLLVHESRLIVPVGGKGHGVMAFRLVDGSVAWQSTDFGAGYAAPRLIRIGESDQMIVFMRSEVAGLDPRTGTLYWQHPHPTAYGVNASMPLFGEDHLLFISSAYDTGSRALRITASGVEEVWQQKKMQLHFSNALRLGDHIYGTSGDFGPVFLTAVEAATGDIVWQKRDVVGKASLLAVGDRVLLLDEKGKLVLASLSPQGVTVHAEHQLVEGRVWAPPTLVGKTLYIRNRTHLFAFALG